MLPNVARTKQKPKMGGYVHSQIIKVWYYLRQIH